MYEISDDIATRAEEAGELVQSAAKQGGKRINEGRRGISTALERGRDFYQLACRRAKRDTKAADGILHENLYQTVLIGVGIGAILGYMISRRGICNSG